MCYNQMAYDISAGTWRRQIVCLWPVSDAFYFDPFNSPANDRFTAVLLQCFWSPRPGTEAVTQTLDVVLSIMF